MELKLDKSTWKPVTFGDVVQEVRTTIKDPKGEGIERVVGLEHIETENIHLSKWASIEEDTTFTKGFKKGHVLFGRRRAYLKKAAQAGFDGICSGDITVMEAKDELLPELLPFLVCNDKFFDYAVKHSAGGLSPRTKFKDLANYEFLLPPKDQQAKLAELLWAADAAACKSFYLHAASIQNGTALLKQTFFELKARTTRSCLGEIGHWSSGGTPSQKNKGYWGNGSIPWISPKDVRGATIESTRDHITPEAVGDNRAKLFSPGSFFLVWRSGILKHTLPVCQYVGSEFAVNQDLKVFTPIDDHVSSDYVRSYVSTFSEEIRRSCVKAGTTVQSINTDSFMSFSIPLPLIERQKETVELATKIAGCVDSSASGFGAVKQLLKSLINQIF
jgi:type I restriction enzyme S subunit